MTNWKTYKIEGANLVPGGVKIMINLGWIWKVHVDYKDKRDDGCMNTYVICANTYPFNTWKEGDYIEVDNDKTRYKSCHDVLNDASVVRKVSSSVNVISSSGSSSDIVISSGAANAMRNPRTMEIARDMSRIVDETGKEVEFKIEDPNSNLKYSLILRKQN